MNTEQLVDCVTKGQARRMVHRWMKRSPAERDQTERFAAVYRRSRAPVMRAIERRVCGCDYGADSWTTRDEAARIAARLGLRPGVRLLDLGAGSGWPGLYLGRQTGCDVALVDLPLAGLQIAAERADNDGMSGNVWTAVADGTVLPFAHGSFDAISHSDLLCCLKEKQAVLAACRRVIRARGRMVFTLISVAPGQSDEQVRRAVANGPEFIETDTDYPTLLTQTGWMMTDRADITLDYAASCRRQLDADAANKDELVALLGTSELAERMAGWQSKLAALDDDLLRRELFVAAPNLE